MEGEGRRGGGREGKGRKIKTPLLNGLPTGLLYHSSQVLYVAFPGISSVFIASYGLLLCANFNSVFRLILVRFCSLTFVRSVLGVYRPIQLGNHKLFTGNMGVEPL